MEPSWTERAGPLDLGHRNDADSASNMAAAPADGDRVEGGDAGAIPLQRPAVEPFPVTLLAT